MRPAQRLPKLFWLRFTMVAARFWLIGLVQLKEGETIIALALSPTHRAQG
ncbi:hypothetical protein [Dictyobacter formicarum]|nr:hypothetical protein [Dictyobacter formicarum]